MSRRSVAIAVVMVVVTAGLLAGCTTRKSSSQAAARRGSSTTASTSTLAPTSTSSTTTPPTTAAAPCTTDSSQNGTMKVCPGVASVGQTVTISGTGCNSPGQNVTAVFLGPRAYVGSGGGGVQIDIPVDGQNRFSTTFVIPRTYPSGEDPQTHQNPDVAVTPGAGYSFSVYPAGECTVRFRVP